MQSPLAETAAPCPGVHGAQAASMVLPRLLYLPEAGGSPAAVGHGGSARAQGKRTVKPAPGLVHRWSLQAWPRRRSLARPTNPALGAWPFPGTPASRDGASGHALRGQCRQMEAGARGLLLRSAGLAPASARVTREPVRVPSPAGWEAVMGWHHAAVGAEHGPGLSQPAQGCHPGHAEAVALAAVLAARHSPTAG